MKISFSISDEKQGIENKVNTEKTKSLDSQGFLRGCRDKSRQPEEEIYKRCNGKHGVDAEVYKAICTLFEREHIEIFFEDSRYDEEKHHCRHICYNAEAWAATDYSHYIRKYPYK